MEMYKKSRKLNFKILLIVLVGSLVTFGSIKLADVSAYESHQASENDKHYVGYNDTVAPFNGANISSDPMITVLTPGLGGSAYNWSNNYDSSVSTTNIEFAYDSRSLIEQLRTNATDEAIVFWAKVFEFQICPKCGIVLSQTRWCNGCSEYINCCPDCNNFVEEDNWCDVCSKIVAGYDGETCDYKFNLMELPVQQQMETYSIDSLSKVKCLTMDDLQKHIIIVFEPTATAAEDINNVVYAQFKYTLNTIVHDIAYLTGGIYPKINLIGHSRGGLTNMQYALEYPFLVDGLFSLGTPYFGTTTGQLDIALGDPLGMNTAGLQDVLNSTNYYGYRDTWNENYETSYSHINAVAFGGYIEYSQILEIFECDYNGEYQFIQDYHFLIDAVLDIIVPPLSNYPISFIKSTLESAESTFFPSMVISDEANDILAYIISTEIKDLIWSPEYSFIVWENDVFVHLDSQLGEDITGGYYNFCTEPHIYSFTENLDLVSEANLPIPHNLEARDPYFIEKIVSMINLGTMQPFETMNGLEDKIIITGFNFKNFTGSLVIPETIKGKVVNDIWDDAFIGSNFEEVFLPASIESIGSNAFKDCVNLVYFTNQNENSNPSILKYIFSSAFSGCISLISINIPNSVETIGTESFSGCISLAYINIPNSLERIGNKTFFGCTSLVSISIPNSVETIGAEAFSGCCDLNTIIIPSSVTNIGLNAFAGCSSLNTVEREFNYNVNTADCYYLIRENLDNDFLEVDGTTISNTNDIVPLYLSEGSHSIKVQGEDISSVMSAPVLEKVGQLFTNSNQDIKSSVESGKNVFYFHNYGRRFVTFTLEASGYSPSDYENAIVVRDLNGVVEKFTIDGISNEAKNVNGSNTLTVYLSGLKNFYVEVNFSDTTVTELKLTARLLDSPSQVDLFDLDEDVTSSISLFDNTTSSGDELKAIEILQSGRFYFQGYYTLSSSTNPIFVVIKETIVDNEVRREIVPTGVGIMNPYFTTTLNLEPGKYYIGYFNTVVGEEIEIWVYRFVDQSGSQVLVTDPDYLTPCGSQISIMEAGNVTKSYRQTFITEGFTRLIYPDYNYGVSASRLDYYWYSSDDNIAMVTEYGTVLALPVAADTTVKIMAVLKADYSKVFVKEFTTLTDLESTTYLYANRETMVNDFLDDYTTFYNAHRNDDFPAIPRPALTNPVTLLVPGDYGYNAETALVARLDNPNTTLELFFEDSDLYDKWIWIVEYTMGIRALNKSFFEAYINGTASGTNSTVKFEICAFLSERQHSTWPQSSNYTIDGFANGFWDRLIVNTININVNTIITAGQTITIPLGNAVVPINIFQYYSWSTNDISYVEFYPWGTVSILPSAIGKTVKIYGRYCYNPRVVIIIEAEIV